MDFTDKFIQAYSLRGNWVDLIFIIIVIYFILTSRGLLDTLFEAFGFIFSLLFSYQFYSFFGKLLAVNFSFPRGISYALGFFIAWFLAESIFFILIKTLAYPLTYKLREHPLNRWLGYLVAPIHAGVIFLFFISFIFAFPVRGQIKQAILDSKTGPFFVNLSLSTEKQLKSVFGEAISETINFITIKPGSNEKVDLGFKPEEKQLSNDQQSESIMLNLLNQEREKVGRAKLVSDVQLRDVAREYAKEMFTHSFFSHVSEVDGSTPADRAERAGITFLVIGENLAFAPDVYVAHQGLINSEGHRRNILSDEFGKVGIGVVDGGIYGKMFVQEFTN